MERRGLNLLFHKGNCEVTLVFLLDFFIVRVFRYVNDESEIGLYARDLALNARPMQDFAI